MNDPWSNLIDVLAGKPPASPESWPTRKVHRTIDDNDDSEPLPRSEPVARRPPKRAREPLPKTAPVLSAGAAIRPFKCPCTNCVSAAGSTRAM